MHPGKIILCAVLSACLWVPVPGLRAQETEARQGEYQDALHQLQYSAAVLGYLYGSPVFELAVAEYAQLNNLAEEVQGPRGLFAHFKGGLPDHRSRWFGAPNPDVLYSSAWVYLRGRPYVIYVPPMDDTWYSVQFEDYFMNNVGYLSSRTIGGGGGFYLVAHSDWGGKLPWGVRDVIRTPTPVGWILLRIAATSENQADIAARYQSRFRLMPLAEYLRDPERAANAPLSVQQGAPPPVRALAEMRGDVDFFRVLNFHLRSMEISESEQGLMRMFDLAGFGPTQEFQPQNLPPAMLNQLRAAAREGARIVDRMRYQPRLVDRNGWSSAPPWLGIYGQDYLLRAIAAYGGIGANIVEEAVYPNAFYDSEGERLSGDRNYTLRFPRGEYPPAGAFWSIAAYDAKTRFLVENAIGRYSIGNNTKELSYAEDGSLNLYLSNQAPDDPVQRANWLPLPPGEVFLIARIYAPLPAMLNGNYVLPPVKPVQRARPPTPF